MDESKDPAPFEGATHRHGMSREPIKATRWMKDGAHARVERYPVERREYKGILVVGPKEKYNLRFGDWVIEDARGRLRVVPHDRFVAEYESLPEGQPS